MKQKTAMKWGESEGKIGDFSERTKDVGFSEAESGDQAREWGKEKFQWTCL